MLMAFGALLLAGCAPAAPRNQVIEPKHSDAMSHWHGAWQDRPYHLPEETLRDTSGQPFNLRTSPTRPVTLLYFGYPECPNICTTVLSDLATALRRVAPDVRDDVKVVVVSIATPGTSEATVEDHEVRAWLDRFDREFVGLTGSTDQVRAVATGVGVEIHDPDEHGIMLHGGQVIAFDRGGDGVLIWTPGMPIDQVAEDVTALVATQR